MNKNIRKTLVILPIYILAQVCYNKYNERRNAEQKETEK